MRGVRTHKQVREMMEHAIKFVALAVILLWARDHTLNLAAGTVLQAVAVLCVFPGAILRMICVLAYPDVMTELVKEQPFLGRRIYKFDAYILCVALAALSMLCLLLILSSVSFK
jgi:hypothetical protein